MLAEGGEAIVYQINYTGYEEVVLKVPKTKYQTRSGFEDLVYESQLIKSVYREEYVVEIKEEIIEIDQESKELLRYCVVVERARYSLFDLYSFKEMNGKLEKSGKWYDPAFQQSNLERFSI